MGNVEVDLAAHCGTSTEWFYLNTWVAVDLVSSWIECVPVWGKAGWDRPSIGFAINCPSGCWG